MNLEEILEYGKQIYSILLGSKDCYFVVCPCSIGDTVNIVAFLEEFRIQNGYNKMVLVIKKSQESLLRLFPGTIPMPLDEIQMYGLRLYMCKEELYRSNNVLYGYFLPKDISFTETLNSKDLPFVYEYKGDVLRIPLDVSAQKISFEQLSIERREELANEYKDAVILFPNAQTYGMLDDSFWELVVEGLKEKDIQKIYTNTNGEPIKGTMVSNLSLDEICFAGSVSRRCIGIRSGIFDMLALTDVSMSVIYSGLSIGSCDDFKIPPEVHLYFDLRDLSSEADIINYSYSNGGDNQLAVQIVNDVVW